MRFLELRHAQCEPPAAYSPVLATYGDVQTVLLGTDPIPAHVEFDAVIVMGGPMGVGDQDDIEWLVSEIAYLRALVDADVPIWGVCLGSQLLAAALGARVYTGSVPEVGVEDVTLTEAGALDPIWGTCLHLPCHAMAFGHFRDSGWCRAPCGFRQVSESAVSVQAELRRAVPP